MLTDTERQMLDLAGARWKYAGARDAAIRERFDLSPTVFHVRVNALLNRADALEYAPMVVNRLRRLREMRRQVRTGS